MPRWRALRMRAAASRVGQRWSSMSQGQHRLAGAAGAMGLVAVIVAAALLVPRPGAEQGSTWATASPTAVVAVASTSPSMTATPVVSWPDPGSGEYRRPTVLASLDCPSPNSNPAVSGGRLYIFCGAEEVRAFDLATNSLVKTYKLTFPNWGKYDLESCTMCVMPDLSGALAVDHGLWVGWADGGVQRLNLTTGKVTINHPNWTMVGYGLGYVWTGLVASEDRNHNKRFGLYGINPSTGATALRLGRSDYMPVVSIACGRVWQVEGEDNRTNVLLDYPSVLPWGQSVDGERWSATSVEFVDRIRQIGNDCWSLVTPLDLRRLTRLGRLASKTTAVSGYDLWSPDLVGYVEVMNGKAWLIQQTGSTSTMQQIDMRTFGPAGDAWQVPGGSPFEIGGSYWCIGDAGGRSVLVRFALSDVPPATATPTPTASATPEATLPVTGSPSPSPAPSAE